MNRSQPALGARRGLTLIELLVALAVFALLSTISFHALDTAIQSQRRLAEDFQRWREIARLLQMVEMDLIERLADPVASAAYPELRIAKPGSAPGSVGWFGYRLDGQRVVMLRWPDAKLTGQPQQDVVLDKVGGLRFGLLTDQEQKPIGLDLVLDLPDVGTIRRFYALR